MINNDYKFDVDLAFGQKFEKKFQEIFSDTSTKFEIKTERQTKNFEYAKWMTTGNIVIEFECRGNPSGLSTTEADFWVHILSYEYTIKAMLIFPVEQLKQRVNYLKETLNLKQIRGGEDYESLMYLIPIKELFNYEKQITEAREKILTKTNTNT